MHFCQICFHLFSSFLSGIECDFPIICHKSLLIYVCCLLAEEYWASSPSAVLSVYSGACYRRCSCCVGRPSISIFSEFTIFSGDCARICIQRCLDYVVGDRVYILWVYMLKSLLVSYARVVGSDWIVWYIFVFCECVFSLSVVWFGAIARFLLLLLLQVWDEYGICGATIVSGSVMAFSSLINNCCLLDPNFIMIGDMAMFKCKGYYKLKFNLFVLI